MSIKAPFSVHVPGLEGRCPHLLLKELPLEWEGGGK